MNEELRRIWEESNGYDPQAAGKLQAIEAKIANIRRAIEDGLSDAGWANARLSELMAEKATLVSRPSVSTKPPQIDAATAQSYRRQAEKLLVQGEPAERKRLLRAWVGEMKLAPERLQVEIAYRTPDPVMDGVVAGAGFVEEKRARFRRWIVETAFRMPHRLVETVSRMRRVIADKAGEGAKAREVGGS